MKTAGLLITLALIAVLGMAVSASAQCTAVLADGLAPNGGSVQVGDTIEYSMTVSVPNVPGYCTLTDVAKHKHLVCGVDLTIQIARKLVQAGKAAPIYAPGKKPKEI